MCSESIIFVVNIGREFQFLSKSNESSFLRGKFGLGFVCVEIAPDS